MTIYRIPVHIRTLTPVVIPEKSGDSVLTETSQYFSGSLIRGIFAKHCQKHIQSGISAEENSDFYKFNLSGSLRFSPAYPDCSGKPAYPVSFSFLKDKSGTETMDILEQNPKAGYKPVKGYAAMNSDGQQTILTMASVKRTISFHMSRQGESERIIGSSKDGKIYNYEAIAPGQDFIAYIYGEESETKEFFEYFCKTGLGTEGTELYLGHSKRTQYGKCSVRLGSPEPFVYKHSETVFGKDRNCIALRFTSDFIPSETFDNAATALADLVNAIMEKTNIAVKIEKVSAVCGERETFVGVWGLKRPRQRHIEAGSAVKISKGNGQPWSEQEIQAISCIGLFGIGQRTVEGYGSFDIWPLGEKEIGQPQKQKAMEVELSSVQDIVSKILDRRIEDKLQMQAWKDVKDRIKDTTKKHIFARLENILSKTNTDEGIFSAIRKIVREKSITEQNLESLKLNNVSLMEIFTDKGKWEKYASKWQKDVFTSDIIEIAKKAGISKPSIENPEIYRKYWLNYFRFARKAAGKGDKK